MEGLLTDIYNQNIEILNGLNGLKELNLRIEKLETTMINKDLTRKQAAEFLKCSEKTIERATKAGDISYTKIGRSYTYSKKAILDFKETRTFRL